MTAESRLRLKYVLVDFISTSIAILLFNVFRYYQLPVANHAFGTILSFLSSPMLIIGQIIFPGFMMLVYYMSGIYSAVYLRSRVSELTTTMSTALIGTVMLFFAALINDLTLERSRDYSLFVMLFALMFLVVYIPRLVMTWRATRRLIRGDISFPALIVGYSSVPQLYPRQLEKLSPTIGVNAVGLIDYENRARFCTSGTDLPIYDMKDIAAMIRRLGIKRIIVIPHPGGWNKTLDVVSGLFSLDVPVFIAADGLPSYMFNTRIINLTSEPFIDITSTHLSASVLNTKRTFDVLISALMLVLTALPVAIAAVAIKLDSRGPVFYRQQRVGRHKKMFEIIKLRTMYVDSEPDGKPALSRVGDSRVTPVGRFLRKYRLDELPQFFNVLCGHMSLVGPRPERPHYIEEIVRRDPSYTLLHRVRPGITSLGMVKYGYASTVDQMVRRMQYDLLYLDNISMLTDLKIIIYTVYTVLSGKGV